MHGIFMSVHTLAVHKQQILAIANAANIFVVSPKGILFIT